MRKEFRTLVAAVLFGAMLSVTPHAAFARAAGQKEPKAKNLIQEVRHQLVMLPYYSVFDNLAYKLDGDKVILIGQVVRPTLKSDAEAAVKSIEGVSSVENDIEVLPLSPNDDRIRLATYRAIYGSTALNRYALQAVPSIHIIVKNGNVTLVGVADSEADKNLAGIRAKGVQGAFAVNNELTVPSK